MSTTVINRLSIPTFAECQLPEGATLCQLKYCENCGRSFARPASGTVAYETRMERLYSVAGYSDERPAELRRDHGERYCHKCRHRQLEPDIKAQEQYKAQLPNEREAKHDRVYQMPRYDKPVGGNTQSHAIAKTAAPARRKRSTHAEILVIAAAVTQAFVERGQMTMVDVQDYIPNCWTPQDAHIWCNGHGIKLNRVGWERTEGIRGPGLGIYELDNGEPLVERQDGELAVAKVKVRREPMVEFTDDFIEQKLQEFRAGVRTQ